MLKAKFRQQFSCIFRIILAAAFWDCFGINVAAFLGIGIYNMAVGYTCGMCLLSSSWTCFIHFVLYLEILLGLCCFRFKLTSQEEVAFELCASQATYAAVGITLQLKINSLHSWCLPFI